MEVFTALMAEVDFAVVEVLTEGEGSPEEYAPAPEALAPANQ